MALGVADADEVTVTGGFGDAVDGAGEDPGVALGHGLFAAGLEIECGKLLGHEDSIA